MRSLTPRQIEVLQRRADGLDPAEVSTALGISRHTVRSHQDSALRRLRAHSAMHAVAIGFRQGWLR